MKFTPRPVGFTIIEMLFAMMVGFLALTAALSLYAALMHGAFRAEGAGLHWNLKLLNSIRRDLANTSLASISSYEGLPGQEPAGVAMLSAAKPGADSGGDFSKFGRPIWRKKVFYSLDQGVVFRWEQALSKPDEGAPFRFPTPPSIVLEGNKKSEAGGGLLPLGSALKESQSTNKGQKPTYEIADDPTSPGGFQVQFVHRQADGTAKLTYRNPAGWFDGEDGGDTSQHTGLVQVTLTYADKLPRTGLTGQVIQFRVKPRN